MSIVFDILVLESLTGLYHTTVSWIEQQREQVINVTNE